MMQGGMGHPGKPDSPNPPAYVFGTTPAIATEALTRLALQDRAFTRAYGIFPRDLVLPAPPGRDSRSRLWNRRLAPRGGSSLAKARIAARGGHRQRACDGGLRSRSGARSSSGTPRLF